MNLHNQRHVSRTAFARSMVDVFSRGSVIAHRQDRKQLSIRSRPITVIAINFNQSQCYRLRDDPSASSSKSRFPMFLFLYKVVIYRYPLGKIRERLEFSADKLLNLEGSHVVLRLDVALIKRQWPHVEMP